MQDADNTGSVSRSIARDSTGFPPRVRAMVEFIEGDLSKPILYPNGGSLEADEAIRAEFMKRWSGAR
jgi:hypothetical protein